MSRFAVYAIGIITATNPKASSEADRVTTLTYTDSETSLALSADEHERWNLVATASGDSDNPPVRIEALDTIDDLSAAIAEIQTAAHRSDAPLRIGLVEDRVVVVPEQRGPAFKIELLPLGRARLRSQH